jgi:predicted ester cyclase
MVQELWNERRLEVADELFPADFDNGADRPRGPDGVKQWHCETATAFPDLHYVVDEMVVAGRRVALRWTATGTQEGAFGPIPPTGRRVTYQGAHFLTVDGGRVMAVWSINDTFGKCLQLGATLLPP